MSKAINGGTRGGRASLDMARDCKEIQRGEFINGRSYSVAHALDSYASGWLDGLWSAGAKCGKPSEWIGGASQV